MPSPSAVGAHAFIAAKGRTLDEQHLYSDDDVSCALFANRAEYRRLMPDAEAGAFAAIVLGDLDRFGRHAHQTMVALNASAAPVIAIWDFRPAAKSTWSFEGRVISRPNSRCSFATTNRTKAHEAMCTRAEQGWVCGGRVFAYNSVIVTKVISPHASVAEARAAWGWRRNGPA